MESWDSLLRGQTDRQTETNDGEKCGRLVGSYGFKHQTHVFCCCFPHGSNETSTEGRQDRSTNSHRISALSWSHHPDFHRGRCQRSELFRHPSPNIKNMVVPPENTTLAYKSLLVSITTRKDAIHFASSSSRTCGAGVSTFRTVSANDPKRSAPMTKYLALSSICSARQHSTRSCADKATG